MPSANRNSVQDRKFGVELEVARPASGPSQFIEPDAVARAINAAGVPCQFRGYTHQVTNTWKVVTDASVSNGFEIVSLILQGEDGYEQIIKVCAVLKAKSLKVNRTCGLHVHVDARDLTAAQITKVFKRYAMHERKIDAWMAPDRRGNINRYCRSIARFTSQPALNHSDPLVATRACGSRFLKVNLEAYHRHRTIEFRQHQGTLMPEKIVPWVKFLLQFVDESLAKLDETRPVTGGDLLSKVRRGTKTFDLVKALIEAPPEGLTRSELARQANWQEQQVSVTMASLRQRGFGIIDREGGHRHGHRKLYRIEAANSSTGSGDKLTDGISAELMAFFRERAQHFGTIGELADE